MKKEKNIDWATTRARLAQLVERKALNLVVVGSSPTVGVFDNDNFYIFYNEEVLFSVWLYYPIELLL